MRPLRLILLLLILTLALGIWFAGPLLQIQHYYPLLSGTNRLLLILILFTSWAAMDLWREKDQKKPSKANNAAYRLEQLFSGAVEFLRQKNLFEKPWYYMLGPTGAGKTALIANSEHPFLLSKKIDWGTPNPIAATKHCEWWASRQAVMVDMSGTYCVNGGSAKNLWKSLLRLTQRFRGKRGINGVILTLDITAYSQLSKRRKLQMTQSLKSRIKELQQQFSLNLPIYLTLTKCDKIPGFLEFFAGLSRLERKQVWGMTFSSLEPQDTFTLTQQLDEEFEGLLKRLNDRVIVRLHQEHNPLKRALILDFPSQLANLKQALMEVLPRLMPETNNSLYQLRGVYLTSAMQQGRGSYELTSSLAQSTALQQHDLQPHTNPHKSFFIPQLLNTIIFHEANLVYPKKIRSKVSHWPKRLAYGCSLGIILAFTGYWSQNFLQALQKTGTIETTLAQYRGLLENLPDNDVAKLLPAFNMLQKTNTEIAALHTPRVIKYMHNGHVIGDYAQGSYEKSLQTLFLPTVGKQLETVINSGKFTSQDQMYGALATYMMLVQPMSLNKQIVTRWLGGYWQHHYKNEKTVAQLNQLLSDALSEDVEAIPLNPKIASIADSAMTQLTHPGDKPKSKPLKPSRPEPQATASPTSQQPMVMQEEQPNYGNITMS